MPHMKVVILAGGQGTRLAEETEVRPKPMVEVGGRPLLWHIMKHYARCGFDEFVVALGYKGDEVKKYFVEYLALNGDLTVRLADGTTEHHRPQPDAWTVHLVDTGQQAGTGGRVGRLASLLGQEPFLLTYGDGVSDVDINGVVDFHRTMGRLATITAVRPPSRFGGLVFDDKGAVKFTEKPQIGEGWINGGFMVLEPGVLDYIEGDETNLEADVLERLSAEGQLAAYRHEGFWQCMDTLRDVRYLRSLWDQRAAPWVTWE
jgi:glucose-1-phosphate cytidylyltransferase